GFCYIVMAYLEGETVEDLLQRRGFLDVPLACALGRQILSGLAAAHARGVIHRDMKPANVFLASAGDEALHAKILDFGISTTIAAAAASPVAGTPPYMAPEQMAGEGADQRTDVYGLGVTLYEALTGQRPFIGQSISALYYKVCFRSPSS